jgi:hypothetical protein
MKERQITIAYLAIK